MMRKKSINLGPSKPFSNQCEECLLAFYLLIIELFQKVQPLHIVSLVYFLNDALYHFYTGQR